MSMVTAGTLIDGKYDVVRQLGKGAFGEVVLAKQVAFDRQVAVKIARQEMLDPEMCARFEREAKLLSMLSHPNIAVFLGFGIWNGYMYTAMEYVAGDTLTATVQKTTIKPKRAFQITRQILSALGHAHAHGVIHRDLKPENVLIHHKTQKVKLIDFGLAHFADRTKDQRLTQEGDTLGSVLYMPPEQCEGREADSRADLYAVGCMLYFMLSGAPPYSGDTHIAVMMQHVQSPIPKLDASKSNPIDEFLARLIAKDPNDRFQSADETLAELTTLEERQLDALTPARKLSSSLDKARHHTRYRRIIVAGAICGLLICVWGIPIVATRTESEKRELSERVQYINDQMARAQSSYEDGEWDSTLKRLKSLHDYAANIKPQSPLTNSFLASIDLLSGQTLFKLQRYADSKAMLEQSAGYTKKSMTDYADESKTESLRGTLWQADMESKAFADAIALADETITLSIKHKNARMLAEWMRHKGIALSADGQRDQSTKILEEDRKFADANGNYREQFASRVYLGLQSESVGDTAGAIRLLRDAIKIADSHPKISYPGPPSLDELRQRLHKIQSGHS